MNRLEDVIVAPITAVGGAVAVVRLSGERSWSIARQIIVGLPAEFESHRTFLAHFVNGDEGLVTPFAAGKSYTGEESVELSVHGSPASVKALIAELVRRGARMAEPGEFSFRAFMNGKMDLSQAEGVAETVLAQTDLQLRQANLMREGGLTKRVASAREPLLSVLAAIEASTDFGEEVGELDRPQAVARLDESNEILAKLCKAAGTTWLVRRGLTVAIVGRPNAGKSTILNSILGYYRAIVADVPGTTRDRVEETVEAGGLVVRLIDTAGLRETDDSVEKIGIQLAEEAMANADHVWYVYDAFVGWTAEDEESWARIVRPKTVVANKCDLLQGTVSTPGIPVKAIADWGLSVLFDELIDRFADVRFDDVTPNARHSELLASALESVAEARSTLTSPVPDDLAVVHVSSALRALGEITGETAAPDVIERVFHDFCIGK